MNEEDRWTNNEEPIWNCPLIDDILLGEGSLEELRDNIEDLREWGHQWLRRAIELDKEICAGLGRSPRTKRTMIRYSGADAARAAWVDDMGGYNSIVERTTIVINIYCEDRNPLLSTAVY